MALAAGWEAMLTAVRNKSSVPADFRELMILRVAVVNRAPYEFDAHVPHAQKAGVSDAKIAAVRETVLGSVFTESEAMVLELADTMTRNIDVPEALMDRLKAKFDARGVVETVATVAAYNMVSRFLVALQIGH